MTDFTPKPASLTASEQSVTRIAIVPFFLIDERELTPEQIAADREMLELWVRIAEDPNVKPIDD